MNRPNVLAFYDRDHLDGGSAPTALTLRRWLRAQGVELSGGRILLVTQCRILHYVFNPASFYYCHDQDGALRTVVAEVDNTFGERHLYLLDERTREGAGRYHAGKVMHVSPFTGMEDARYRFRFAPLGDRLGVAIREEEQGLPVLDATMAGRRMALSDATLAWMLLRYPFQTARVTASIHVQAFRLWRKRVAFHSQPPPSPAQIAQRAELRRLAHEARS